MLRLWLASQRRSGSSKADDTEARLQELCVSEGWSPDGSDGEEEEEEMDNSETLEDSDIILSDSGAFLHRTSLLPQMMSSYEWILMLCLSFLHGF